MTDVRTSSKDGLGAFKRYKISCARGRSLRSPKLVGFYIPRSVVGENGVLRAYVPVDLTRDNLSCWCLPLWLMMLSTLMYDSYSLFQVFLCQQNQSKSLY